MTGRERAPRVSRRLQRWFARYARFIIRRGFHAVRVHVRQPADVDDQTPVIVYLNHPSWWDPLFGFLLAFQLFPDRDHFAPIDADALEKYRFLGRLGLFPVRPRSREGARMFLSAALDICTRPSTALWITPQGRFEDPRRRPVRFEAGLGHLARRLDRGLLLPVAVEYSFWEERRPEALVLVDRPILIEAHGSASAGEWTRRLERRLEDCLDELAGRSIARDGEFFDLVIRGREGVGGVYDAWRWLRAVLGGKPFRAGHGRF